MWYHFTPNTTLGLAQGRSQSSPSPDAQVRGNNGLSEHEVIWTMAGTGWLLGQAAQEHSILLTPEGGRIKLMPC